MRLKIFFATAVALGCISASVLNALAGRLESVDGVIEQTRFTISDGRVVIERTALNSKMGETQHVRFKSIDASAPLDQSALPAEIESGFLGMTDSDAYWDVEKRRWMKVPKGFAQCCTGPSLDENSVFFSDRTFVSDILDRQLENPGREHGATSQQPTTVGVSTFHLSGEAGKDEKTLTVDVAENGMIRSAEVRLEGALQRRVINQVTERFAFVPSKFDTSIYDQFSHLTVENDGMTGLKFRKEATNLVVAEVRPRYPAARAGMIAGEVVIAVNGIPLRLHTTEEFNELAKGHKTVVIDTIGPDKTAREHKVEKTLFVQVSPK